MATSNRTGMITGPDSTRRIGRPLATALGLGLGAALLLTGCGAGGGDEPSENPASTDPGASSTPSESATQSSTPAPSDTPSATETATAPPAATATYTTESGAFTWTFPETWTASQEEFDESAAEYTGEPYEVVLFHHPELAIEYRATTGMGATDNDGPKPEVVEVLDTEELPDVPVSEGEDAYGTGPVWYRASLSRMPEDTEPFPAFDGGEYLLSVAVVNVAEGLDPTATDPESFWSSWFYEQPPRSAELQTGATTLLFGSVTQEAAEEVTGETGEEALRAFLDTPEYGQLRSLATSMQVDAP